MKITQKLGLAASLAGALMLAACGGDSNSGDSNGSEEQGGVASVATFDDLAHCTKSHYGEIVFVEEESTYFECTSEDWAEMDESKLDSLLAAASSSSEADEDKPKSSSSLVADSTETVDMEKVKVDSVTVSGFAQKGPFASGSAVTVYGLDSLLEKTKTKFTGKIAGDSGYFKIEKIALPSQFALVEVSGYYQNEVTGKKTSGTKTTLSALVDLSEGKTVKANVNLFTELEYARAKNLVLKEKFNIPAAKKRATKELLAVFGGKGDENLTATSLSLSDTGSAGTALLSASILLQGDFSAGKFGQRLSDAAELFATSGTLDDAETLAAMADWASKTDSTDNFAAIRENVKAMKLVETVPDFESALYAFWTDVYGLVECTDSLESTIKKNENKLSDNYGAGYACTAKRWHKATALDTELGLCTGKMEGSFKEYKGGKTTEYYVCRTGTWQQITETQFELKECTEKRENEYVAAKSGEYFVCTGKQWLELDAVTYELKLCTEKRDMEIATTKKSGSYVCEWDGQKGSWREASDIEAELGVCGSKDVATDSIYRTNSDDYYLCASGKWEKSDKLSYELQDAGACTDKNNLDTYKTESFGLYVCDNKEWREATDVESEIGVCTEIRENEFQKTDDNFFYVCANNTWKEVSELDYSVRKICSESVIGEKREIVDEDGVGTGEKLECTEKNGVYFWKQVLKCGSVEYNENNQLCDTRDNQLYPFVTIGKQVWMAKNLNYRQASMTSYACDADKYGRLYTWGVAIDSAAIFSTTGKGCGDGVTCANITYRGICPKGWHLPSKSEWEDLLIHVGISNSAKELKATEGWDKYNGNDTWGFAALPGGIDSQCNSAGFHAQFWTSSSGSNVFLAYFVYVTGSFNYFSVEDNSKTNLCSVRCVKDE